jgi:hypothetical protein
VHSAYGDEVCGEANRYEADFPLESMSEDALVRQTRPDRAATALLQAVVKTRSLGNGGGLEQKET